MPRFLPTTLRSPRLTLRMLTPSDAASLFAIYRDDETMRYWSCAPWREPVQAVEHITRSEDNYRDGSALQLGVTLRDTGELIGTVTLYAFMRANRRCEIGYLLARPHWGHGYMGEALALLIEHGFEQLELNRIEADLHPANQASAKLLGKLHFRLEGQLRERWLVNGELSGSDIYGLLRSDWRAAGGF
ncbi:GNAT family N-acetyltransferase [Rugamonas sp. CCM 8940]|uniref:GNAT family N-acetyltransferase n=1 Tax=Rugamonas sp. CCM 8940 TaxID=2765359 RepID=UPI0018F4DBBB|nr:GNAT family N-acetyltransferase [Rugamonas sp. CCM 8940]MBJ7309704.1 GNAT family N-acetyltransferase [Rugamonas sp. CCM 8940]